MEGIFPTQRPSHPFRIIESDAMSIQSMTSLGRVGRILAGSIDVAIEPSSPPSSNHSIPPSSIAATTSSLSIPAATTQPPRELSADATGSTVTLVGGGSSDEHPDRGGRQGGSPVQKISFNGETILNEISQLLLVYINHAPLLLHLQNQTSLPAPS